MDDAPAGVRVRGRSGLCVHVSVLAERIPRLWESPGRPCILPGGTATNLAAWTPHQTHNTTLEVVWSVIPLLLCVGIFFWGLNGWMKYSVAPGEAMEIQVTAKQWLWQFEYPDGSRTVNDAHVPVNKPVRFILTSDDVLHDFFVPDMRVKHDIVPGRYTQVWFTPTTLGLHVVTCAEYCGKGHSDMQAKLTVETEDKFKEWLATGGTEWMNYTLRRFGERCSARKKVARSATRSTARAGRGPAGRAFTAKWRD